MINVFRSRLTIMFTRLAMFFSTWGWTHDKLKEALDNEKEYMHWWKS